MARATFRKSQVQKYYGQNSSPHHYYLSSRWALWYSDTWSEWVISARDSLGLEANPCWSSATIAGVYTARNGESGIATLGAMETEERPAVVSKFSSSIVRDYQWSLTFQYIHTFPLNGDVQTLEVSRRSRVKINRLYMRYGPLILWHYADLRQDNPTYFYDTGGLNLVPLPSPDYPADTYYIEMPYEVTGDAAALFYSAAVGTWLTVFGPHVFLKIPTEDESPKWVLHTVIGFAYGQDSGAGAVETRYDGYVNGGVNVFND